MRAAAVAVLPSVIAAVRCLSWSWSFASTTTITDVDARWYTASTPFLTTITTDVSGTVETLTVTKVSISIGTEPPSAIPLATSSGGPTVSYTNIAPDAAVSGSALKVRGEKTRAHSDSTGELITRTHSHAQSSTIDDSDVLPTTSTNTSQTSNTESSTPSDLASSTFTDGFSTGTAVYSTITGFVTAQDVAKTLESTTDPTSSTSTLTDTTANPATSVLYYTSSASVTSWAMDTVYVPTTFATSTVAASDTCDGEYSSTSAPSISIATFWIPTTSLTAGSWTASEGVSVGTTSWATNTTGWFTNTMTTATLSADVTTSSSSPSSTSCEDETLSLSPVVFTYPAPVHTRAWWWGNFVRPNPRSVDDEEPPRHHAGAPAETNAVPYRGPQDRQWD